MGNKVKSLGLIGFGMVAGIAVSMQFSAVAQRGSPLPLDELRQLSEVFSLIKSDYVEQVDERKLVQDAIAGMVSSLDPHSVFLDKSAFQEMRETIHGKFVGVGIEVVMDDGYVKVVAPIEDSPAWRAGIQAGDYVTRLDGQPLRGLSLDEAIKKMRGAPRSKVVLTVARKGQEKPLLVPIVREEIRVQSVKAKMIEPGYAWVRIAQFQEPTVDDLVRKLGALYAKEPQLKGVVLDLRNDPGGVVQGAVGVAAAFLPQDVLVVSTDGQLADARQSFHARPEFYGSGRSDPLAKLPAAMKSVPLVVLVNSGSASASEIVAGALQDYGRATIMGSRTFGKGSVQTLRQISADTAVKLTTARYYTPKGRAIQATGIDPDILLDESAEGGADSLRLREADLDKHLAAEGVAQAAGRQVRRAELDDEQRLLALAARQKPVEFGGKDDFQLAQALRHFKGLPVKTAKPDLAAN